MNLLHRYIFKQIIVATVLAVGLFVFVLVLGNVMRQVLDLLASGRLDLRMFLYLLVLLIPGVIPYALPLGMLTAVLLVVGRFCAQREYTAMRAVGLSLWALAAPILLASCLGVLLCLFINFYYAPAADHAYNYALASLARNDPLRFFQPGVVVREFPDFVIRAGGREDKELTDVWVWELDKQGRAVQFAHGRRGRLDFDLATDTLTLVLQEGVMHSYLSSDPEDMRNAANYTLSLQGELKYPLAISKLLGPPPSSSKLSLLTLGELLERREQPPPQPNPTAEETARWRMSVQMQIQRYFAGAFSVLALAMFGLPLALRVGRGENFVNLAIALGLALAYYFLLFSINLLHDHPALRPDLLLWVPNFIFEILGGWMLFRAARR